ncbi:MAG: Response regulator MprA [bacterium ADurb.Bin400]|nr:MAG: Response regulator MprA [bacterium ADurb.Bin400]
MQKILFIDDDRNYSDLYKERFEYSGYEVKQLWRGEGAVDAIKQYEPDIILLDIMLPGIPGDKVLDQIRNDPQTKDTPVIVLTALLQDDEHIARIKAKANDYLVKIDLMPRDLVERVEEVIAQSKIQNRE